MNEKYIVPSYWLIFIIIPAVIAGGIFVAFSIPLWALLVVFVLLLVVGEHGIRKWAKRFFHKK